MLPPASTNASRMRKLVDSSAVQPNTLPPRASGATASPLFPIRRFSTTKAAPAAAGRLLPAAKFRFVHHFFVKFSDTGRHVGSFYNRPPVDTLVTFWSHALAAACFATLMLWRLGDAARQPAQRLIA